MPNLRGSNKQVVRIPSWILRTPRLLLQVVPALDTFHRANPVVVVLLRLGLRLAPTASRVDGGSAPLSLLQLSPDARSATLARSSPNCESGFVQNKPLNSEKKPRKALDDSYDMSVTARRKRRGMRRNRKRWSYAMEHIWSIV